MRSSRSSSEHQEAVARRLALLSAELAAARPGASGDTGGGLAPDTHTRVREGRFPEPRRPDPPPVPEADPSPARAVPVPGRHAARRGRAAPVPTGVAGPMSTWWRRAGVGPAQLTVVALVVAAGLAVSCWWLLRSAPGGMEPLPDPVPRPQALVSPTAHASPASTVTAASRATGTVVVDVAGRVRHPGIAVLDAGSRVVDAIEAAGGARPGVDLSSLNLARVLVDGEQVLVGERAPGGVAATVPLPPGGVTAGALVNLNTADQGQLESLPEVGPVTALAIIGWREEHGGFTAVDQLLDVDGIGEATLNQIAPLVTV
ncbi:MAG: helix-hairpin-helix domain-containing protein [Nocardioidaceae bacterium]